MDNMSENISEPKEEIYVLDMTPKTKEFLVKWINARMETVELVSEDLKKQGMKLLMKNIWHKIKLIGICYN